MKSTRILRLSLLGTLLAAAASTSASIVTNLTPAKDTSLRSSVPNNNLGGVIRLPLGVSNAGTSVNRGLVQFDLSGLPVDAIITSAKLRFNVTTPTGGFVGTPGYGVHRLLKDWGEGNKFSQSNGDLASAGEATWNSRFHGTATWGAGGGQSGVDFISTASATATFSGFGSTPEFSSATLLADVHLWQANPGTNFGWILIATSEPAGSGELVGSRDDPGNEPVLILEYTVPAPPSAPLLSSPTAVGNEFHFTFDAEANRAYTVELRTNLALGTWTDVTNISASPTPVMNAMTTPEAFFRVRTQ
jgi:hypothetical protein